ncbi:MAG TPA: ScpA family protein [Alphaproteobacteria bacterium]|nr:ScpA family protein [Alphaproteobacteria bacterium]
MTVEEPFEEMLPPAANDDHQLVLDLDGFEGPIDVLLTLARDQKVDLAKISILELADQYLSFIQRARRLRLEIAADYLVMAAWLAYLKSRLLLPEPEGEGEPTGAELAAALAFQLQRLEAMQQAGVKLLARPRLGQDFFRRGAPETTRIISHTVYDVSLYDLLKAYGEQRGRRQDTALHIAPTDLYSMDEALRRLTEMLGHTPDWRSLAAFLPRGLSGLVYRSAVASTFAASLELVRAGQVELRQDAAFGQLYLRVRAGSSTTTPANQSI